MDKIINLGIPHVGEKIFEHLGMMDLNECLRVSETWKKIVGEVVVKRWKDYFCVPLYYKATEIVQVLLDHPKCDNIDWNAGAKKQASVGYQSDIEDWYLKAFETLIPFVSACNSGNLKMVKLFLKYAKRKSIDLNARDFGNTGFYIACRLGHIDVVKELLDNSKDLGIDLNANPSYTNKYLDNSNGLVSALNHKHVEVAKLILRHPQGQLLKVPNNYEFKALLVFLQDEELKDLVHERWGPSMGKELICSMYL